jgi:hypothetical protein
MTTFEQWSRPGTRPEPVRPGKKYDIRVLDQFHGYCEAVARAHRHRDEAQVQSQFATRRGLATMVLMGGVMCYYLLERVFQLASLL